MRRIVYGLSFFILLAAWAGAADAPLGLPKVPIPSHNPLTPEKIQLGEKLFNDERFSTTGKGELRHLPQKGQWSSPTALPVSEGIDQLKGTRNAPTVVNAAYLQTQFWDGREPTLEEQSAGPFHQSGGDGAEESRPHPQDRPLRSGIRADVPEGLRNESPADHHEGSEEWRSQASKGPSSREILPLTATFSAGTRRP